MSHKAMLKMKMNSKDSLLETLKALGISYSVAENLNGLKTECGYSNTISDVDIRLEKDSHGSSMKSVGFQKNKDGTYTAVGDFWSCRDARTKEGISLGETAFKSTVSERYAYINAIRAFKDAGYEVEEDVDWTRRGSHEFVVSRSY
jgi:hypothetical protein